MKGWMRRLKGLNGAAITSVETTTARVYSWPLRALRSACVASTPPEVDRHQHRGKGAVDEGAVDDYV